MPNLEGFSSVERHWQTGNQKHTSTERETLTAASEARTSESVRWFVTNEVRLPRNNPVPFDVFLEWKQRDSAHLSNHSIARESARDSLQILARLIDTDSLEAFAQLLDKIEVTRELFPTHRWLDGYIDLLSASSSPEIQTSLESFRKRRNELFMFQYADVFLRSPATQAVEMTPSTNDGSAIENHIRRLERAIDQQYDELAALAERDADEKQYLDAEKKLDALLEEEADLVEQILDKRVPSLEELSTEIARGQEFLKKYGGNT